MKYSGLTKRVFMGGDKKSLSFRLPGDLVKVLEKISEEQGWTITDVVQTALDEYAQWETQSRKDGKRKEK